MYRKMKKAECRYQYHAKVTNIPLYKSNAIRSLVAENLLNFRDADRFMSILHVKNTFIITKKGRIKHFLYTFANNIFL